jgi:NAD(P)-dependent dehydrogenase (short-subunit alcohol dehydrogenase family)
MIDLSLDGQVAIVTGGSKGIGLAIAHAFAGAGARVALAARKQETLDEAVAGITQAGGTAVGISADVNDRAHVKRLVSAVTEAFGTVDVLVNNAGAAPFMSTIDQTHPLGFEKYFRVNFFSAVYCTRAVAPILLEKRSGCVLNIASVAGLIAAPGLSYYGTAKAALISLTRTTAREWAGFGVRANAITPGWIETDMNEPARQDPGFLKATTEAIALGRWGSPQDVAGAALFLCSPAAAWITGSVLLVDGGQLLTNAGVV